MIENMRRAGIPESQNPVAIRTGIEGFADGMSMFPRLKEWENQIALATLREGKAVEDLRHITPFRQYLGVAQRATNAGRDDPFIPFAHLFDASPRIDMLVSFGSFHTIRTWTWTLAQRHPHLNLPLEQFFQDAMYTIVPYQARAYDPSYGSSFNSFLVEMLKKRFTNFVNEQKREHSSPVSYEEKPAAKKGRAAASKERVVFASLDAPMSNIETPQTFLAYIETTRPAPQEKTHEEDQEAKDKIHLLSTLAGLSDRQEETLVGIFVYGGDTTMLSQLRQSTDRAIRYQRQIALERIGQLGFETVNGVLTGKYETLEDARASMLPAAETPVASRQ
jgi:DNA-directed RNA polymerase specialized sigma24 family protein